MLAFESEHFLFGFGLAPMMNLIIIQNVLVNLIIDDSGILGSYNLKSKGINSCSLAKTGVQ